MITTILAVLGFVKELFTGEYAKYGIYAVAIVSLGIGVWWITDEYGDMKVRVAEQEILINALTTANTEAQLALSKVTEERDNQQKEFLDSVARRTRLETKLQDSREAADNAIKVFEKECGRIERLMQKKASLIVRFANRATDELRDEFKEATRDNQDSNGN